MCLELVASSHASAEMSFSERGLFTGLSTCRGQPVLCGLLCGADTQQHHHAVRNQPHTHLPSCMPSISMNGSTNECHMCPPHTKGVQECVLRNRYVGCGWLTFLLISWGVISALGCLLQSAHGYLAQRIILGLVEAGTFPGQRPAAHPCSWQTITRSALTAFSSAEGTSSLGSASPFALQQMHCFLHRSCLATGEHHRPHPMHCHAPTFLQGAPCTDANPKSI